MTMTLWHWRTVVAMMSWVAARQCFTKGFGFKFYITNSVIEKKDLKFGSFKGKMIWQSVPDLLQGNHLDLGCTESSHVVSPVSQEGVARRKRPSQWTCYWDGGSWRTHHRASHLELRARRQSLGWEDFPVTSASQIFLHNQLPVFSVKCPDKFL